MEFREDQGIAIHFWARACAAPRPAWRPGVSRFWTHNKAFSKPFGPARGARAAAVTEARRPESIAHEMAERLRRRTQVGGRDLELGRPSRVTLGR
jgi:hypothetical protein